MAHIFVGYFRARLATLLIMIGKLRSVVLDCPDPRKLADFYAGIVGGEITTEDDTWVVLTEPGGRRVAFQRAPQYEPPRFPDSRGSQQFHLDFEVDDVVEAEAMVLSLGATRVTDAVGEDHFQVYRDPVGHPFCLVWGVQGGEV